ncbi:COG0863 DNA modification methylase [uncultured Caudovirales phage]|uniref:COG0863 DNA modification methylase n=1 Tax=uncultured Caudovirales phage TaxID=2100421 RepID=A0A6J5MAN9_9CAUD|nr:COG0863 DNA modification methylase [uncultured Caudovirales phage]
MIELNTIYNEDCLEGMKRIPDKSVDMILCDLPYGTTQNKWDSIIPLEPLWQQYERVIKDNGAIVLTATQPFSSRLGFSKINLLRYSWVWEKPHTGQLNAKKMPLKNFEEILVFYKTQPTYNPQFTYDKPYEVHRKNYKGNSSYGQQTDHSTVSDGKRYPKQILRYSEKGGLHPTQKPVALFEYLIKTYTNENDLVLDNCMGSGTTAIACMNTNRNFIGFELDTEYHRIACERVEKELLK